MASLVENKKAHFDYEFKEHFEAGIELLGLEVKSLRAGRGSLTGAHIIIHDGEGWLVGADIPPYQANNTPTDYDSKRTRRILLTKKELQELSMTDGKSGLTIVPISMYIKGRKIKINIAIARGKKKHDKREVLKKRDLDREMERGL